MKIPFVKIFYFFRQKIGLILEVSDCKFTYAQPLPSLVGDGKRSVSSFIVSVLIYYLSSYFLFYATIVAI